MTQFLKLIQTNYNNILRMSLFEYFKTGNPTYDAIISTIFLSLLGYIINYIYDNNIDVFISKIKLDDIKCLFYKKNTIIIEGKRSSTISTYSSILTTSSMYSDRFKALWCYIIDNIDKNDTIYSIKESHSTFQTYEEQCNNRRTNLDIFMVFQSKHFVIDKDIFVNSQIEQDESRDEKDKSSSKTDKITINIYSYVHSISHLKKYIDIITDKYLLSIKQNRKNKKFIYSLDKVTIENEESNFDCWREDLFESARTFNNIFFDGKKEIVSKIDFFLNNRDWYYQKGIPYSLGIGLHGPPGTGKTSFIKALANYTNRNIIVISLKIIKTKRQLEKFFFENTYNDNNSNGYISFDKKIIVFEDIDCIGDIVLDRNLKSEKSDKNSSKTTANSETVNVGDIIQSICELNENGITKTTIKASDELITLDDILNLWDGIRETPGRILVISSNHYDKLDSALVRPGRIDITHELNNASHKTISEMYSHLFETEIDNNKLQNVTEYFYTPAEIINMYVTYKSEELFMKRLLENIKV